MIHFSCPHCAAKIRAPDEKAGARATCPGCKQKIPIPGTQVTPALGEAQKLPMVRFKCPLCNAIHERQARFGGEIMLCPNCRERIEIPKKIPAEQLEIAPVLAELVDDDSYLPSYPVAVLPSKPTPAPAPKEREENIPTVLPADGPTAIDFPRVPTGFKANQWIVLKVSARLLAWPPCCACCLGEEQTELEVSFSRPGKAGRVQTNSWRVPYCFSCFGKMQNRAVGPAIIYEGWQSSVHQFRFWNAQYARAFAEANAPKIVR